MIIAGFAPYAAAKLVELTDSEKTETARKATLDLLKAPVKFPGHAEKEPTVLRPGVDPSVSDNDQQVDEATQRKLLQELAENSKN